MASKKRRREASDVDLHTAVRIPETSDGAVAVVRWLTKELNVNPTDLQEDDSENGAGVSSAKVTYTEVAPLVGLKPWNKLYDIQTFDLHRSRIPTSLFKAIVEDIDVMLIQYGPPPEHQTEEARSRFFCPVFNHLVKQFNFMLRNDPETRSGTRGRVEYVFKTLGAIAILFIQMELKVGNDAERLDAIAQLIAKSDDCDLTNHSHGFSLLIHCIFSDGLSFEFFTFGRTPNPSFLRGCVPGDPKHLRRGLKLPDFTSMETSLPFILQLRCVCEIIFDMMLSAYIAGLKAYYYQWREKGGLPTLDFARCGSAVHWAEHAQTKFREAARQCKDGDIDSADVTVGDTLGSLQTSTEMVTTSYKSDLIMKHWDDDEVCKA